jgi:hypothetical protein
VEHRLAPADVEFGGAYGTGADVETNDELRTYGQLHGDTSLRLRSSADNGMDVCRIVPRTASAFVTVLKAILRPLVIAASDQLLPAQR